MNPTMPQLSFVPVKALVIHERHDEQRTLPLVKRIRTSGVFRNPPVVSPLQDGSERYMVLDGANRTTALLQMGYPHALVQVVQPDDPGLGLQNWNHVVWELNPARFLHNLQQVPDLELVPGAGPGEEPDLFGDCGLVQIQVCDGPSFAACTPSRLLVNRVALLNAIVDTYRQVSRLDRTSARDLHSLGDIYPQLCGLVIFPRFRIKDLLYLSGEGCLLPAGITRFTISPRALHVNYPLKELASPDSIEEKNERLVRWIQERLARKGVRYYAEATFLFDE